MKLIADTFNKRFEHWKITLPEEEIKTQNSGYINQAGWLIQYCFGKDDDCEYMDYYATHRMTDDTHVRIHTDGRTEYLPALLGMHLTSEDPVEAKRLEDEYYKHNREIAEILAEKGFDRFTINMILHAGLDRKIDG